MNENDNWKKLIKNNIKNDLGEIPNKITEEWLKEAKEKSNSFRIWGFTYEDLRNKVFDKNISFDTLRRISFSTQTIINENAPFKINKNMYKLDKGTIELHEKGINGEGINVAVLDYGFGEKHNEIKDSIADYRYNGENRVHFHGTVVTSNLSGKTLGIAPNVKVHFYEFKTETQVDETIGFLNEIYYKNLNGANIRVVNISSSYHRKSNEFEELLNKLKEQGCYVIDSRIFGEHFTCINVDSQTGKYYYSNWQSKENIDYYRNKIAIISGGRMEPLIHTTDQYMYCGESSYSWAIPRLSGYFALALQLDSTLSFEEFVEIAENTKTINEEGITLFNVKSAFDEIMEKRNNKKL